MELGDALLGRADGDGNSVSVEGVFSLTGPGVGFTEDPADGRAL